MKGRRWSWFSTWEGVDLNHKGPPVSTTTKREIVESVAVQTGYRRADVHDIIQAFLEQIATELRQDHRIEFRDFGVFEIRLRAPRLAQNPKTLQKVIIPQRKVVKFKPGRHMRFIEELVADDHHGPAVAVQPCEEPTDQPTDQPTQEPTQQPHTQPRGSVPRPPIGRPVPREDSHQATPQIDDSPAPGTPPATADHTPPSLLVDVKLPPKHSSSRSPSRSSSNSSAPTDLPPHAIPAQQAKAKHTGGAEL